METHLEESLNLAPADRTRLRAHLQWLLIEPPTMNRIKSRIQALSESDLNLVARFAVTIAGADGIVSSDEVKVLNRVYSFIGLGTEQLHRDIHKLASAPPTQPVTVMRPDKRAGYKVPPPPATSILDADRVELDRERIAEVMKATREVSDLLTEIFEGPAAPDLPETDIADTEPDDESSISEDIGASLLDPTHAELVRFLATRPNWPRSAFEESATKLGLMPGGAIETINDASFSCCDEPLVEGDDLLEVNEYALKELLDAI